MTAGMDKTWSGGADNELHGGELDNTADGFGAMSLADEQMRESLFRRPQRGGVGNGSGQEDGEEESGAWAGCQEPA